MLIEIDRLSMQLQEKSAIRVHDRAAMGICNLLGAWEEAEKQHMGVVELDSCVFLSDEQYAGVANDRGKGYTLAESSSLRWQTRFLRRIVRNASIEITRR